MGTKLVPPTSSRLCKKLGRPLAASQVVASGRILQVAGRPLEASCGSSLQRWRPKRRGPQIWGPKTFLIWLIEHELEARAKASSTIGLFRARFLSPSFLASTSLIFYPNAVDSFARATLFRRREGVLLKTAKTAVFAAMLKNRVFLAGCPFPQSAVKYRIFNGLTLLF